MIDLKQQQALHPETGTGLSNKTLLFCRPHQHGTDGSDEQTSLGIILFSTDHTGRQFTVEHVDRIASHCLDLEEKQISGTPLVALCDADCAAAVNDMFLAVLETGTPQRIRLGAGDGNKPQEIEGMLTRISAIRLALIVSSGPHNSHLARAIHRGKHEWELTVDAIDDIITIMDSDLRILRANRAAHKRFGFRLGELVGKKCHEVFQANEEPCPLCPVIAKNRSGSTKRVLINNQLLKKTFEVSSTHINDPHGDMQMIVHIARDVTDSILKEAERQRLATAIEQTSEVVVITDTRGTIQYVNPAFTTVTGYSRIEALGSNINMLKSDCHDDTFYRAVWETLLSGNVWHGRLINKAKDGRLYSETNTISPIFDNNGVISAFVAVKRDISREEQLERQLQQAAKLEAIGTLAGGIAHDFNNILSAILGYAQIAKSQLPPGSQLEYPLNHILGAGERAADLIEQILTFSRQEPVQELPRPINVQPIIKESLKLLRSSIPTTISLTTDIDDDSPAVLADPVQIHQLVMNLCTNAMQAIESGHGEIRIEIAQTEIPGHTTSPVALPPGRYLRFTISDNGCGMDESTSERIFEPFFTTKPKDRGTGLGLAVVHGIVKKHNGDISVRSTPGLGSHFTILLPAAAERPTDLHLPDNRPLRGNEHLLLVDDEQQLTDVLTMTMERLGYRITSFNDSLQAVACFRKRSGDFDLVITDMTMPHMTGVELSRELLSIKPSLPIILVTGHHERINRDTALRIGIREFLQKPLRKQNLARVVRDILDHGSYTHH